MKKRRPPSSSSKYIQSSQKNVLEIPESILHVVFLYCCLADLENLSNSSKQLNFASNSFEMSSKSVPISNFFVFLELEHSTLPAYYPEQWIQKQDCSWRHLTFSPDKKLISSRIFCFIQSRQLLAWNGLFFYQLAGRRRIVILPLVF